MSRRQIRRSDDVRPFVDAGDIDYLDRMVASHDAQLHGPIHVPNHFGSLLAHSGGVR